MYRMYEIKSNLIRRVMVNKMSKVQRTPMAIWASNDPILGPCSLVRPREKTELVWGWKMSALEAVLRLLWNQTQVLKKGKEIVSCLNNLPLTTPALSHIYHEKNMLYKNEKKKEIEEVVFNVIESDAMMFTRFPHCSLSMKQRPKSAGFFSLHWIM